MKYDKKQVIIIVSSVCAGFVLFCIILVNPLWTGIQTMGREVRVIEQELKFVRNIIKAQDTEETGRLLTREEISLAIDEITREGKALNINFIAISPKDIERAESSAWQRLPIHMNLESEYKDIGLFWEALENLRESIVTLRSFTIQRDESILPLVKTTLILDMYVKGENGER